MTWASGLRYEGRFRDGQPHGRGVMTDEDGGRKEGVFRTSPNAGVYLHGKGKVTGTDGLVREGMFHEGKLHGRGVHTWPDGERHEGAFRDGQAHSATGRRRVDARYAAREGEASSTGIGGSADEHCHHQPKRSESMETAKDMRTKVLGRAGRDAEFRARLLADPKGAIGDELGVSLPESLAVKVHEESAVTRHLVLPLRPARGCLGRGVLPVLGRTVVAADDLGMGIGAEVAPYAFAGGKSFSSTACSFRPTAPGGGGRRGG